MAASDSTEQPIGRVLVVGAINVDYVVTAPRLPRPGETVVGDQVEHYGGGKGANAAVAAAAAGARVRLAGAVGADDAGSGTLRDLREHGVSVDDVAALDDRTTGSALIVVDHAGENQIAVGAGANYGVTAEHVGNVLDSALPGTGCLLVSTEIPAEAIRTAVRRAASAGVPCVLNPAPVVPELAELLDAAPLLTPNASELGELTELCSTSPEGDDTKDHARALARLTEREVVVTLGGEGSMLVHPDERVRRLPAPETTVRDTTGAGDAFNGALAAHLAAGWEVAAAVELATAAASRSVATVGARPRTSG
ncbi:bifunctional hydroxymethylpyrimidine kinase/phosphomethylpyrimidine kinase [Saccharopolyspora sp. HNM0986]|uniref:PfkB family carbohydrate kinase n=1 Tax=Saccharopolyspora galaxeae TaxID=2781241 RepID=UPI00190CEC30|nr:PfkB family carbohydrate kinase [Saccharopolyspora sp. HNM0986]MBK0866874.1 bifunctional hydroxymethylpyrimidine kinase/phosphomethylpyrimidine kinase [Saccharopolyspora sp. HNM0986]